jgi:hypothetical protein
MPLHPEAQAFLRQTHDGDGPPLWQMTPVAAREVEVRDLIADAS